MEDGLRQMEDAEANFEQYRNVVPQQLLDCLMAVSHETKSHLQEQRSKIDAKIDDGIQSVLDELKVLTSNVVCISSTCARHFINVHKAL